MIFFFTSNWSFCLPAGMPVASWIFTFITDTWERMKEVRYVEMNQNKHNVCVNNGLPDLWVAAWNSALVHSASILICPAYWEPEPLLQLDPVLESIV